MGTRTKRKMNPIETQTIQNITAALTQLQTIGNVAETIGFIGVVLIIPIVFFCAMIGETPILARYILGAIGIFAPICFGICVVIRMDTAQELTEVGPKIHMAAEIVNNPFKVEYNSRIFQTQITILDKNNTPTGQVFLTDQEKEALKAVLISSKDPAQQKIGYQLP